MGGLALGTLAMAGGVWALVRPPVPAAIVPADVPGRCTSHAACTRDSGGRPSLCRPARGCVALASPDCRPLAAAPALQGEHTLWIGAMFPLSGEDATAFGTANLNALDLARRDFDETTSGHAWSFGIVGCDDANDPKRAASHLVDLGVPAVVGFRSSVEAIDLTTSIFLPNRVLTIAALNTNPLVTMVPQAPGEARLVWRTTYNNTSSAGAISALVANVIEPRQRGASGTLGKNDQLRVALLRPKNTAGAAFSEALFGSLVFNGRSALHNREAFRELTFDASAGTESAEFASIVAELLRIRPHAIVFSGTPQVMVNALFGPLEKQWPAGERHRPSYASLALLTPEHLAFIGKNVDLRHRFFGVTTVSTTAPNARFVMHYNEVFDEKITRTISPNSSYDAFYLLAYAASALGDGEAPTGPVLARAFARLAPPGRPVDVGVSGIFEAFAALRAGGNIDLNGATGSMDFDPATGESPFDQAIICAAADEHGAAYDGIESGLVWSAKTGKLEGTLSCP